MTRWKLPDKTLSFNTWGELEATGAAGDVPPKKMAPVFTVLKLWRFIVMNSDLIVINSEYLIVIDSEYLDLRFETDDSQHLMKQRYFEDHPA